MEPFYFGKSRNLFGVFHPASDDRDPGTSAVILCYPIGSEYIRSYRAYFFLANQLAKNGIHAFRFDYSGTGDSMGTFEDADIQQWTSDIHEAIGEVRNNLQVKRVYLLGARLGGSLAYRTYFETEVHGLILWHPIKSGTAFLYEIDAREKEWRSGSFAKGLQKNERMGFVYSDKLLHELKSINLFGEHHRSMPGNVLLLDNALALAERGKTEGMNPAIRILQSENKTFWVKDKSQKNSDLLPANDIQQIIKYILS